MEVPVALPLDADGFLRRECPSCEQQFKWHNGPANEEAEREEPPVQYYCPFCGMPAGPESWWTREQLEYSQGVAGPALASFALDEIEKMFRGVSGISVSSRQESEAEEPPPLTEPNDMGIISSPCHAYEPIKVPVGQRSEWHCLVCGSRFAV
jgi:hypothetical protein